MDEEKKNIEEKVEKIQAEIDEKTDKVMAEASDEAKEAVKESKAVFSGLLEDLKKQLGKFPNNKEEWNTALEGFRKGCTDLMASAQKRFGELKSDPQTTKAIETVKGYYTKVSEAIVSACKQGGEKINSTVGSSEAIKNTSAQVLNKGQEAVNYAKAKYEDFTNNPEVQATVVKARDAIVNAANKAVSAIKHAVDGSDNNKED
jgi:hypothetical protein